MGYFQVRCNSSESGNQMPALMHIIALEAVANLINALRSNYIVGMT